MSIKDGFTPEDYGIAYLRQRGYAVVVFNPDELRGADPERVQDRLVDLGNEVIDTLADRPAEDLWAEPNMQLYEVICRGFDGSTDATDHLVQRVLAPGRAHMDEAVSDTKATWCHLGPASEANGDVDFTLPGQHQELRDCILHFEVKP